MKIKFIMRQPTPSISSTTVGLKVVTVKLKTRLVNFRGAIIHSVLENLKSRNNFGPSQ